MSTATLLLSLFKHKAWANQELLAALKPIDGTAHQAELHGCLRILNHIYVVDRIFAAHLGGEAHQYTATNTPETPPLEQLRAAVQETDRWFVATIPALSPQDLAENIEFAFTDGALGRMSREEMLAHVASHGAYHRGAVGRIMTELSIAPPRDIFTVYLHQSEPARRERP